MTYQFGSDEREDMTGRARRAEISLTCEIRQGSLPWTKVKLHDISETGFRMDWRPGLNDHQTLYIRIPGLELLASNIRWKREGWIGAEFSHRLYGPIFDSIVAKSMLEM